MFECSIQEEEDVAFIYPRGELELASIAAFREALRNSHKANRHIIVDMSQLHYIDSGAIRLLFAYRDIVRQNDRRLLLVDLPPEVERVMKIVDSQNALAIFSCAKSALQSIK